jgi:hypothetical protein
MAKLVVKDLVENAELDRKAMREITGGSAGPRLGIPQYHSGHFNNPLAFEAIRLLPGGPVSGTTRWGG